MYCRVVSGDTRTLQTRVQVLSDCYVTFLTDTNNSSDSVGSSSAPRPSNSQHVYSMDNEVDGPQEYINILDDQNYENVKSPPKRHRSSKQSVQDDLNITQSYIEVTLEYYTKLH